MWCAYYATQLNLKCGECIMELMHLESKQQAKAIWQFVLKHMCRQTVMYCVHVGSICDVEFCANAQANAIFQHYEMIQHYFSICLFVLCNSKFFKHRVYMFAMLMMNISKIKPFLKRMVIV